MLELVIPQVGLKTSTLSQPQYCSHSWVCTSILQLQYLLQAKQIHFSDCIHPERKAVRDDTCPAQLCLHENADIRNSSNVFGCCCSISLFHLLKDAISADYPCRAAEPRMCEDTHLPAVSSGYVSAHPVCKPSATSQYASSFTSQALLTSHFCSPCAALRLLQPTLLCKSCFGRLHWQ